MKRKQRGRQRKHIVWELQTWRERQQAFDNARDTLRTHAETMQNHAADIGAKSEGWRSGTLPLPCPPAEFDQYRAATQARLEELSVELHALTKQCEEMQNDLERLQYLVSQLPGKHQTFIRMLYEDGRTRSDVRTELHLNDERFDSLHHQAVNLLKAIG